MSGRPEILFPLFAGVETLPGVGPKLAQAFEGLGVSRPRDLIFTLPHSGIDRRRRDTIRGAELPGVVTVEVEVGPHRAPQRRGAICLQSQSGKNRPIT